jgi:hypothetical protein
MAIALSLPRARFETVRWLSFVVLGLLWVVVSPPLNPPR